MSADIVIGTQWGDEGKGKIVDLLAKDYDYVVRFHGGPNAGHTITVGGRIFKLHHIPSGVLQPNSNLVIANGVVVDPAILLEELRNLKKEGISLEGRLLLSPRAHVIFPYHKILEGIYQGAKQGILDTKPTGRGIGPVHADKVSYLGIRIGDLFQPEIFSQKLKVNYKLKRPLVESFGHQIPNLEEVFETYLAHAQNLKPYVAETYPILRDALIEGKKILMEGAQGTFLDVDHGIYPYTTASNMVAGAVNAGAGIPPKAIGKIIGVAKAYVTRVGDGPFPTEITGILGEKVREKGREYGTTTGRPRRVGWFDAEMVKFSVDLSGVEELILTKLDVLGGFKTLKIAKRVGYYEYGLDHTFLEKAKPVYLTVAGWEEDISSLKDFKDLPKAVKDYIKLIEELVGVPIKTISVGPERNQTIFL